MTDGNLNLISDEKARKRSFAKRARGLLSKAAQLSTLCGAKVVTLIQKDDEFFFFCDKGEGTNWFQRAEQLDEKMRRPGTHIRGFYSDDYSFVFSDSGKWLGTDSLKSDMLVPDTILVSTENLSKELERQTGFEVDDFADIGCGSPQLSVETLHIVEEPPLGVVEEPPLGSTGVAPKPKKVVEKKDENWCLRFLWSHPKPMSCERVPLGRETYNRTLRFLFNLY